VTLQKDTLFYCSFILIRLHADLISVNASVVSRS